ncbi:hypothetical protein KC678_01825 [Candidatus Dojkabacteria bacterium]|uniref:Uncharacterized protein n=1 Tax=Candidatus Dojkabacteria bacterium TaxID=2099670 RepID=A0A955I974_9BACT|nr:hypothetical protein [Candidatus Dojkabacteria bacterium]
MSDTISSGDVEPDITKKYSRDELLNLASQVDTSAPSEQTIRLPIDQIELGEGAGKMLCSFYRTPQVKSTLLHQKLRAFELSGVFPQVDDLMYFLNIYGASKITAGMKLVHYEGGVKGIISIYRFPDSNEDLVACIKDSHITEYPQTQLYFASQVFLKKQSDVLEKLVSTMNRLDTPDINLVLPRNKYTIFRTVLKLKNLEMPANLHPYFL